MLLPGRLLGDVFAAVNSRPVDQAGRCAADAVANLIDRLDLPHHLSAYGLSQADLETAARPVASAAFPFEDLVGIYKAAL